MAETVHFMAQDLRLEGLFEDSTGSRAVAITHPHPQYGGDMYNTVVDTIADAYHKNGYATLRFNFRGVGMSQGNYDNGVGEQMDVVAALSYLAGIGKETIDLVGYSFGAWVNTQAVQKTVARQKIARLVMVSPPMGMIDASEAAPIDCLQLVVTGSADDIAPASAIESLISVWNPDAHMAVIEGADHFYAGHIGQLESAIASHL